MGFELILSTCRLAYELDSVIGSSDSCGLIRVLKGLGPCIAASETRLHGGVSLGCRFTSSNLCRHNSSFRLFDSERLLSSDPSANKFLVKVKLKPIA